jgi:tripartite-type tricarboxylate transporter receptor subunit TctC
VLRRILASFVIASAALAAHAQEFPVRPVQLLVPFPAGSIVDIMARAFSQVAEQSFGQRILVVNRPGGSQTIAVNAMLAAPADGYTIVYAPVTPITIHPHRMKLTYTFDSVTPVCQTFENIFWVTVGPNSPHKTLQDLVDYAKANPGKAKYATPGISSSPHLAAAELWKRMGVDLTDVPYPAVDANAVQSVIKNEVESAIATTNVVVGQKLRALAVFANERHPRYPDVPTVAELGHPILASGYGGLFVRQGTPAAVIAKIDDACRRGATDALYRDIAEKQFQAATYLDSAAFTARATADYRAKAALIPTLNLPAQ